MISIYYTFVNSSLENANPVDIDLILPVLISQKIAEYASPQARALRIAGKRLLGKLIAEHYPESTLSLKDLEYNEWGKPHFPNKKVQFSIAHAGDMAICAFSSTKDRVGIDVEEIKQVRIADIEDYLTREEQLFLKNSPNPTAHFYDLWTRKEAVLKASGDGVGIPFATLEALNNPIKLNGQNWYWHPVEIAADYIIHLASSSANPEINLQQITF